MRKQEQEYELMGQQSSYSSMMYLMVEVIQRPDASDILIRMGVGFGGVIIQMEIAVQQIDKEVQDLQTLNQQLRVRAEKFGSEFTPLTLSDYKLFKIRKARETGNINYLSSILLEEIQDLQERKNKIKERIEHFYPELKVQTEDKFFAERANPDLNSQDIQIRHNAWYLFGVDYMSNEMIRNYFHINPHFRIEWINDSSCNLVFNSKEEAEQAVLPLIKGDGMKDENDIWYVLPDYEVEGTKRKLYCRLATSNDVKKQEIHGHNSQYYRWMINKQKLGNYVKKKAHHEIMKTKSINRTKKYHQSRGAELKKDLKAEDKRQDDSSSSEVQSDEMAD